MTASEQKGIFRELLFSSQVGKFINITAIPLEDVMGRSFGRAPIEGLNGNSYSFGGFDFRELDVFV